MVAAVEQARSVEAAADELRRDDITLASAVRWVRRRLSPVCALLTIVVGLLPSLLLGCAPTLTALRPRLACEAVLYALREVAEPHLAALRPPLGFQHPSQRGAKRRDRYQQRIGPDPPPEPA